MSNVKISYGVANTIGASPYSVFNGFGSVTDGLISRGMRSDGEEIDRIANEFLDLSYLTPEDRQRFIRTAQSLVIAAVRVAVGSIHEELEQTVVMGMKQAIAKLKKQNAKAEQPTI